MPISAEPGPMPHRILINVGERVLLVPWVGWIMQTAGIAAPMGIPQEICLKDGADGLQLAFSMAEELHALRGSWEVLPAK